MEQYRLAFYFINGIKIGIEYEWQSIIIDLLCIKIQIALSKEANGIRFFKD
jgi:hypothetical protein